MELQLIVFILPPGYTEKYPDIVFSGLNFGSNMGDDVIYSGTVGAALEEDTLDMEVMQYQLHQRTLDIYLILI